MADPVFVQPHFDDVALSCGGTVAQIAREGAATIVTVFGGDPGDRTSEFVRFQHERWKLEDGDAVGARRKEDLVAVNQLGESVSTVWLDYLDAIYRRPEYSDDLALFGTLVDDDRSLIGQIAGDLAALGDPFVLPLAIGSHVDHQLVFEAGRVLAAKGADVWCYPDLPYALDSDAYRHRLEHVGDAAPCVRSIDEASFESKWRAIECYASQLPVIFRAIEDPRRKFFEFGRRERDVSAVELFWKMDDLNLGQR
ncbi:MAG: PIG-L family deacetylase [Thermomicrobiales bacterium]